MSGPSVPTKLLISAWIVVHLTMMTGSALQAGLQSWTLPYERALGVHQTWPMFVGVPTETRFHRFVGILADGSEVALPDLHGENDPDGVIWRYSRRNKFERNALSQKREYLRTALVRWQCRRAVAEGRPIRQVSVRRVSVQTPEPGASPTPRASWARTEEEQGRWNCPRR